MTIIRAAVGLIEEFEVQHGSVLSPVWFGGASDRLTAHISDVLG